MISSRGIAVIANTGSSAMSHKQDSHKTTAVDGEEQPKFSLSNTVKTPLFRAVVMSFSFMVLLGVVYTQQQPYRFTTSNHALMNGILNSQIADVASVGDIWQWLDDLAVSVGGDTYQDVLANCGYDTHTQVLKSGGDNYTLHHPAFQDHACSDLEYVAIKGDKRKVYISGNNEVLSFGIFTGRSVQENSIYGANGKSSTVPVTSEQEGPLDPVKDPKILQMCDVQWGECIMKDGYGNSSGSTFHWPGVTVEGYRTYVPGSEPHYLKGAFEGPIREITPCYSHTYDESTDQYTVIPGNPDFEGGIADIEIEKCETLFVSDGLDIRTKCLLANNAEPTARMAFVAADVGVPTVSGVLDEAFGCDYAQSASARELARLVVESDFALRIYLSQSQTHGTFYETESEYEWVASSTAMREMLQFQNFIDKNTRFFRVSVIVRNLGVDELYYAAITVDFFITSTGKLSKKVYISYIPIVQYYYGADGYPWLFKDVVVFEVLFILVYLVYCIREIFQFGGCIHSKFQLRKIAVVDDDKKYEPDRFDLAESRYVGSGDLESINELGSNSQKNVTSNKEEQDDNEKVIIPAAADVDQAMVFNFLDWVTITIIALMLGYRIAVVYKSVKIHEYMTSIGTDYDDYVEEILAKFYAIESDMITLNGLIIAVVFLGLTHFFRYMAFSPRLGIVTHTISHAAEDLIPVLVIFVVVLTAYGVLGTAIYGHKLSEWSNLGNSISSLFIMILGEFGPYFDMKSVKPHETAIFFWSFIVVVLFILFNMVLAVIFTVYDEKQSELKEAKEQEKKNI